MNDLARPLPDDIAVVGLSCRLPGAADPESLWRLLRDGVDAIAPLPAGRWSEPVEDLIGVGGFLDDVAGFDPQFFGISPREALGMDPQQRLALELAWEALEDAGMRADRVRGGKAGVFVGAIWDDYAALQRRRGQAAITHHTVTGTNRGIIANRISYFLGLHGPSMTVDCGQSSSLVSVHLAAESLRRGESELALAGGVNLNLVEDSAVTMARFGGLSPDGRCHTFDARANGFVRGEGGGLVVLKRLRDAVADGDKIHCVIRGSAMNNDGAGESLASPSSEGQRDVLRAAYRRAAVAPADVQYVELHGTGTKVGDPVEAAALGAVFGARESGSPLLVGSVKTNVGHLEGAAGIAGLLKVALAVRHREIPASLNFATPNPAIRWDEWRLEVPVATRSWPAPDRPLLAGVSSFGMGGTNCHVVVGEPPAPATTVTIWPDTAPAIPWVVSGRGEAGLRAQAARLREYVTSRPGLPAADVAFSLATGRSALPDRAVVVAAPGGVPVEGLAAIASGAPDASLVEGTADADGGVVLVFPGQGSQWAGMASALLDSSPVFADALAACDRALGEYTGWSVLDVLRGADGAPSPERVDVVQPALFAVMVSLARLWESAGVRPAAVAGHSQGEIAAAHVAGALSLDDAARVVALRSKLIAAELAGQGAMLSVPLPADEVAGRIARSDDARVSIAVVNGPRSTVLAGEVDALDEIFDAWTAEGVGVRRIPVDYASHSRQVERIRDRLLEALAPIRPRTSDIPMYSTVTGAIIDTAGLDADYWYRNLRGRVDFHRVVRALLADGFAFFTECSPHPVLTGGIRETADTAGRPVAATGTLRRGAGGWDQFLSSLAQLWVRGFDVDWTKVVRGERVDLPTYAFQRQRYWPDVVPAARGPLTSPEPDVLPEEESWLSQRLAGLDAPGRRQFLLDLVRGHAAAVAGHGDGRSIDDATSFTDQGFDSVMTVELRARLGTATGLSLSTTASFDHPTPARLAGHLSDQLLGETPATVGTAAAADAGEPIAVVAMACRYPGGVSSPEDLWDLVAAGKDVIGEFPVDRGWQLDELYDPEPGRTGRTYARTGGFLYDAAEFDAGLFGISPREATAMDPQQRLLLEVAWETFERGGLAASSLRGSDTGVFVGAMASEYGPRLQDGSDRSAGYLLTGTTGSVLSGRISYAFGLTGPAMTVDTACSASLVALHLASSALRRGECSLALAGGVTVMAGPGIFVEFSQQRGLSPDGRCRAFGAGANGTGWAEGAGLLLLERLSDARRNGHPVLAVLRGSAVNSDGASNGLTAPNGPSQERVIRRALADARLSAADVDAVEAHGTGTSLGDPIEANALLATYGQARTADQPLWLGSLKSNIGHSQAAAGVGGVIKMVQAMRHGVLPQTLHAETPSPLVEWSGGAVSLLGAARDWPRTGRPRRAAVSSFGIGGTNAHVILEENPAEPPAPPARHAGPVPWVVSGHGAEGLRAQASRLREYVADRPGLDPADVGFSLAGGRTALGRRAVVVAGDRSGFAQGLDALAAGGSAPGVTEGTADVQGGVAFVFPGQGGQWPGMATELLATSPVFREAMTLCDQALGRYTDWSLLAVLRGAKHAPPLDRVDVVQPALFAVMVSLAAVWRSWGVSPGAVVGHSQGEIAAAHVAGALSLDDAARVVALRSKLIAAELAGRGTMLSVALPVSEVEPRLTEGVSVAVVNGPGSTVLSGEVDVLEGLFERWTAEGVRARRIPVDYASHSAHVERIREELLEALATVRPRPAEIPFYSSVTGHRVDPAELDAGYWYRNLREPVDFHTATRTLLADGYGFFLECGPHPVLSAGVQETAESGGTVVAVTGSLRRDDGGLDRLQSSLAQLWVRGLDLDWTAVVRGRRVDLPTYAFQRKHYWMLTDPPRQAQAADWRYRVAWRPLGEGIAAAMTGSWLVLVPPGLDPGELSALERALRSAGGRPRSVTVHSGLGRAGLVSLVREAKRPTAGVLSLLALAGRSGFDANVALVQALGDAGVTAPLWLATRGAVTTGPADPPTAPIQAMTWGLGYSVGLAYPTRWGGVTDLPVVLDDDTARLLARALAGVAEEDQLAVRESGLYVRRLVRPAPATPTRSWRTSGTALVTGGTGGLGAHAARWLVRSGAQHIVLASRRGPAAAGIEALEAELTGLGAEVTVATCDTADRDAVAAVLAAVPHDRPLRTVVHAAGLVRPGKWEELTQDGIDEVVRPKVDGALHLDELTRDAGLDAFVLFSSGSGVWGSGDQGVYGAANAFLDALAHHRRSLGLPATAMSWGAWAGGGMGARDGAAGQWRRQGLRAMAPESAVAALQQALDRDETALTVADIDWERFAPVFTSARPRPLLDELPEVREAVRTEPVPAAPDLAGTLAGLSEPEVHRRVLEIVRTEAGHVLGHGEPLPDGDERGFLELGFDSLTTLELRNRLNTVTGLRLPVAVVLDHPTPGELAKALSAELATGTGDIPAEPADPVSVLFRQAYELGKVDEGLALLREAARLRPSFARGEPGAGGRVLPLTTGENTPRMICFAPIVATAGAHGYSRFAAALRGEQEIAALTAPGFTPVESLPSTLDAVVHRQAGLVRQHAGDEPVLLVGTSSGGWLAHAVARHLESEGHRIAGVALLDTYLPDARFLARYRDRVIGGVVDRQEGFAPADGVRLSAMGWYLSLFSGWRPSPITAPTLLVRATEPLRDRDGDTLDGVPWQAAWNLPHVVRDVPGDHFTILEEHAGTTAEAVRSWLTRLPAPAPARIPEIAWSH